MGSANTLTRRNPLAATEEITLATETSGPQITELLPSQIYIDAGLQTRDKVDQGKIAEYAEAMANGDQFPPLLVYRIGTEQGYLLVKGFHRFNAHIAAFDQKPIRCKITHGSRRDALKEALGDNADHGLPLNREDKRKKIKIALADAEWGQWSDREIAKLCKVSHPLVAEVRREVTGNSSSDQPRTYTNKHGTVSTMHTERISQANSARASTVTANDGADGAAPRELTVDETLAVILRVVEQDCKSPQPYYRLEWLRTHANSIFFVPALSDGVTLHPPSFLAAYRQAFALLEAEVNKAAKTAQEAPQPPPPSVTPPAAPTPQPAPTASDGTAILLPPFPVTDAQQFLGQTRRAISMLEEEGWSTVADFLRAVCRIAENQPTEQPSNTPSSRPQRVNHLLSHYRLLIDLLPDYGELTGDYTSTLALRRALEPMIRRLELE